MSNRVTLNTPAPNFSLQDYTGNLFTISDIINQKNVLLVFNRGFT